MKAWIALVALLLAPEPCPAETLKWETLSTPHFSVYYEKEDHRAAQAVAENLEEFHNKVATYLGSANHPPIKLYLAPTEEVFRGLIPTESYVPMWAIAVAYPEKELIIARSPRSVRRDRMDLDRTLTHEIAHVLLAKAVGHTVEIPKWLDEGFAMYQAEQWGFGEVATMMRVSLADQFIPLEEISKAFPAERHAAAAAYAQSFSVCAFLMEEYGPANFRQFIRSLGEHGNVSLAMKSSFGLTLRQLEKAWRRNIRRHYTWIPVITSGSALWAVAAWLIIAGYARKRAWERRRLEEMKLEEEGHGRDDIQEASDEEIGTGET